MLRGCRRVHIGQTVPRLLFIKCLNPPSQPDNTGCKFKGIGACSALCYQQRRQGMQSQHYFSQTLLSFTPSLKAKRISCMA